MQQAEGKKITITMDGPYRVEGDVDIGIVSIGANANGESVSWTKGRTCSGEEKHNDADASTHLCRCGHSRNKPFCDGTHEDNEFCGREKPERGTYRERAEEQKGHGVNLLDDPSLCAGARFCDVGDNVWRYARQSGEPGKRALAIEEAGKCPSGRVTVVERDGTAIEPDLPPAIGVIQDPINDIRGPLWVQGGIAIEGHGGDKYEVRNRVTLCRCGESDNQPFCDGSHYNCEHMRGADK